MFYYSFFYRNGVPIVSRIFSPIIRSTIVICRLFPDMYVCFTTNCKYVCIYKYRIVNNVYVFKSKWWTIEIVTCVENGTSLGSLS